MKITLKKLTEPGCFPIETNDAMNMVKLDPSNPANAQARVFIEHLIASATDALEKYTTRCFITTNFVQTLVPRLVRLPNVANSIYGYEVLPELIKLWRAPVQEVTSIVAVNQKLVENVQPPTNYAVNLDVEPCEISLVYGGYWAWWVRGWYKFYFTAGYGDTPDKVPPKLRQAIRMTVAAWYATRENLDYTIPPAAMAAADDYVISSFEL